MSNEELIQEILFDASAYGLLHEVRETARKILDENPNMDRVSAYQMAYEEWVK